MENLAYVRALNATACGVNVLSTIRAGKREAQPARDDRNPFEIDADRIQFSDAFRLLKEKTQVHGESGNDYVRDRLTHSLEVSRVGRSLGARIGRRFIERVGLGAEVTPAMVGQVAAAACLMHDIGNPPFGHTGEDIISSFFRSDPFGVTLLKSASPRFKAEATHFDGNAQGFRVVTRLQGWSPKGGLMLTSASLAASAKYPFTADPAIGIADVAHKYGVFEDDLAAFREVAELTGLLPAMRPDAWRRHPLAYFVEAADDICYRIVDIEDAADLGIVPFKESEDLLKSIAVPDPAEYRLIETKRRKLVYLRGKAIQRLVDGVAAIYADDEQARLIETGAHAGDLVLMTKHATQLKAIARFSQDLIYENANRKAQDANAYVIITSILKHTGEALLRREETGAPIRDPALDTLANLHGVPYEREGWVRALCDHLTAMTDRGAIDESARLAAL